MKVPGAGLAGAAMLGPLEGCGRGDRGGKVSLEWWDYYIDLEETDNALNAAIKEYMKQNPNVTIERTKIGFADLEPRLRLAPRPGRTGPRDPALRRHLAASRYLAP